MAVKALHPTFKLQTENDVNCLIKSLYESSDIDHITYQGKKYYETSNSWGGRSDCEGRSDYDPDVECDGYNSEECIYNEIDRIEVENEDDVKYVMRMSEYLTDECIYDEINNDNDIFRQIFDYSYKVILSGYESIIFENIRGINEDHRGSTHCKIDIPYHADYTIDLPCDLETFADAIYKVKSHKWDNWYELYSSCTIDVDDNLLHVYLDFDHGS